MLRMMSSHHPLNPAMSRLLALALLLVLALAAAGASAQPNAATKTAFRDCNDRAFLALGIARNYLMTDRNREAVLPHLKGNASAEAMAEELFRRVEAGEVRYPGQYAADTLFQCARDAGLRVGVTRSHAALCFTRTDIAFFLHAERARHVVKQGAVANVLKRLTVRRLYPTALVNQVAEAVYGPSENPPLQPLMEALAWSCINQAAHADAAASAAATTAAAGAASATAAAGAASTPSATASAPAAAASR